MTHETTTAHGPCRSAPGSWPCAGMICCSWTGRSVLLTARYCLYAVGRRGRAGYGDIHHVPWPLQDATAEVRSNTMTMPLHLDLPRTQPVLHFARYLEVVAWRMVPLGE